MFKARQRKSRGEAGAEVTLIACMPAGASAEEVRRVWGGDDRVEDMGILVQLSNVEPFPGLGGRGEIKVRVKSI